MRRFKVRILVLVAALAVTAVFATFAKGQEVEDARYGDLKALAEGLKIDIAKLAGDDDRLGELEAYKLLEWMKQEKRRPPGPSRKFLSEILDPARFANPGKAASWNVVALRIIGAISLEIRGAAATTAGFSDLLLPLLGVGSERLRQSVVDAFGALVEQEKRTRPGAGRNGPPGQQLSTIQRLCEIVEHNPPPPSPVLEDVSKILWESDGKLFLSHVIAGMVLNQEKYPASTPLYLKELRERLRLGFATPKGWDLWWKEQQELSLPEIFVKVQKKLSQDNAVNWKQSLKRFRETRDYELLLAELQATLQSAYTVEHRIAVVEALGDYADWLRGARLPGSNAADQEKLRSTLQARACERLLAVVKGEGGSGFEQPGVRRQALISLRHYQSFLAESAVEIRTEISDLTVGRTQKLLAARPALSESSGYAGWRAELLELVRAAGAFKLAGAKKSLDAILHGPEFYPDLELQLESIRALGHLLKGSLDLVSASLFIERFKEAAELAAASALKLRIACATALNARPEDGTVLGLLRTFHADLLRNSAEVQLQMPAIAGLSTLAQSKDPESLDALIGVLSSPEIYDTQVLIAAVDAISYVGNREALDEFLPFLKLAEASQAREKALGDHLMKRVQGLIRAEGVERLAWVMKRLESRACLEDNVGYLASSLRLVEDTALMDMLLPKEPEGLPANGKLRQAWAATLVRLRAADLTKGFDESMASYKKMAEFLAAQPQVGENSSGALREFQNRLRQQSLKSKILAQVMEPEKLDVQRLLDLFTALTLADGFSAFKDSGTTVSAKSFARWIALRWIERLLSSGLLPAGPKETSLYAGWNTYLAAEENASFWKALPPGHRNSFLKRLEALRTKDENKAGQE